MIPENLRFGKDPNLAQKSPWSVNLQPLFTIEAQPAINLVQITMYSGGDLSILFLELRNLIADNNSSLVKAFLICIWVQFYSLSGTDW